MRAAERHSMPGMSTYRAEKRANVTRSFHVVSLKRSKPRFSQNCQHEDILTYLLEGDLECASTLEDQVLEA